MITVELKKVNIGESVLEYKAQLIGIMSTPVDVQYGAKIDEIRSSVRVLDVLEKAMGDTVDLEDADFRHMVSKINSTGFTAISKDLLQFIDDVLSSKKKE